MSAYLVAPEQISEMVKWAVSRRHKTYIYNLFTKKEIDSDPENLVKILAKANVDSINARYNEQDNSADFVADCLAELNTGPRSLVGKSYMPNHYLTAADIYRMCSNYDYQACEVNDWIHQDAYWIVQAIKHQAADVMSDVAQHKWGYTKNNKKGVA